MNNTPENNVKFYRIEYGSSTGPSPLTNPSVRPSLPIPLTWVVTLVLFLSLIFPCFPVNTYFSLAVVTVLALCICLFTRTAGAMLLTLIPTGLFTLLTMDFTLPALYLSFLTSIVFIALLISHKRFLFMVSSLVGAFIFTFLIVQDLESALLVLIAVPAGILLGVASMSRQAKTVSVLMTVGGLAVVAVVAVSVIIYQYSGAVTTSGIQSFLDYYRTQIVSNLMAINDLYKSSFSTANDLWTSDTATQMVSYLFNLLPAVILVTCSILAFISQSVFISTCRFLHNSHKCASLVYVTQEASRFTMSIVSAVLFTFCFIAALVSNSGESIFNVVVTNIYLILEPGLFLIGLGGLISSFVLGRSRIFTFILYLFVLFLNPAIFIALFAFTGAYYIVRYTIHTWHSSGNNSQDPQE